jgi:hypothetical protein
MVTPILFPMGVHLARKPPLLAGFRGHYWWTTGYLEHYQD